MALQNKSANIPMDRNLRMLKQQKHIVPGNENILPGKNMLANVSKIPTRSVLGIVNANCVPDKKASASDFKKPTVPVLSSTVLKNTISTKFSSTSSLSQNVLQNRKHSIPSIKRNLSSSSVNGSTAVPRTILQAAKTGIQKPTVLKAPNKTQTSQSKRLLRNDSTASLFGSQPDTNKTATLAIEQCEQDLNNVSLEEDVDVADVGDPFLLGCYVKDIYSYLFELEKRYTLPEDYLQVNSKDASVKRSILPKYRTILVDYLIDMQQQYNLFPETLFLAVYMLDKYLQLEPSVTKANLQCVGVAAMFLASKYEEIQMPDVTEFAAMTENYVKVKDILAMEVLIVQKLGFDLSRPHPLAFLRRFSKVAKAGKFCHIYAKYFIELALNDYNLVHERPSMIAAAVVYLAHVANKTDMRGFWSRTLIHYTRYTEQQVMPVVYKLAKALMDNTDEEAPKYRAVKDKYSKSNNCRISVSPILAQPSATIKSLAAKAKVLA
uniref:G2/mitotic-specific cyclin-B2 n=1 Tax=Cacopsylla melanoneura TaxID=428564 RepID=A0A8D8QAM9_9HEMI